MGPAHDPHVLWLQLGFSSFFLQRWPRALDVFTRIMEGVAQASIKSPAPIYKSMLLSFRVALFFRIDVKSVPPADSSERYSSLNKVISELTSNQFGNGFPLTLSEPNLFYAISYTNF